MTKVYKIKFYKIAREHYSSLIADQYIGLCQELPAVGERFAFWKGENTEALFWRSDVSTNVVSNVISTENTITFITKSNSVYEVEILEEFMI